MPIYATITMIMFLSSMGLPLLNGFVGEFTILGGTFLQNDIAGHPGWFWTAWAVPGVVLAAAYLLWLYQRVFFGTVTNPKNEKLHDLTPREVATFVPLIIMAFWIGLYPKPFFQILEQPVNHIVAAVNGETPKPESTASIAAGAAAPSECAECGSSAMSKPAAVKTGAAPVMHPATRTTPPATPAKGKN
jgi:NADH-quinone oxidoreductase subunit M